MIIEFDMCPYCHECITTAEWHDGEPHPCPHCGGHFTEDDIEMEEVELREEE